MIQLATNNEIILNGRATGYTASQTLGGTVVTNMITGKNLKMPQKRYSLSCDNPASGAPGTTQFEVDFLDSISAIA